MQVLTRVSCLVNGVWYRPGSQIGHWFGDSLVGVFRVDHGTSPSLSLSDDIVRLQ